MAGVTVLVLFASCGNSNKTDADPFASITHLVDSAMVNKTDSIDREKTSDEPKPIEADESFDDFIYNFASDDALQRQRVVFPLPYYNGERASKIDRKYWKHDDLFAKQSYYTLLFDREEDMDLVGDTSLTSVQVEWIFVKKRMVKKYYFERIKGAWMLEAINLRPIEENENEDFVEFFGHFATDSIFQSRRIRQPLVFVTTDPDDDFSILETTLDLNQWFAFKPALPADKLSNINYGQQNDDNASHKILALKGIGNGFSNILYFQRKDSGWELYKFEEQVFKDCFYRIMEQKYSLLSHNTFGIDVSAACFLEYASVDELRGLIGSGRVTSPYLHIGGGSNLLFTKDYEGTILHSRIGGVEVVAETDDDIVVRVGAGVVWDDFVDYCVQRHWYGVENLSLIPGEVGASAVQNIGAYGVEVKDLIVRVETLNIEGKEHVYDVTECGYSYRDSIFKRPENKSVFVTYVSFRLSKREHYTLDYGTIRRELEKYPGVTLDVVRRVIIAIREEKLPDPRVMGNAGSFFMNPIVGREQFEALQAEYPQMPFYEIDTDRVKIPAGWMIDQCGWKGKALGPAAVHDKQALVLVNRGGAKGADVIALSDAVRASVRAKFGIDIHPEVNFI